MKREQWIRKSHFLRQDEYICSRCGASSRRPFKVCPNCRAAMGRTKRDGNWVDEAEELSAMLDDDW